MDLSTRYMGLELKNPLIASAGPLSRSADLVKRLEDAGVAAVVMHSLFEEQLAHEAGELEHLLSVGVESFPEALNYFPRGFEAPLGPDEYLAHIARLKESVDIPIIASLNGSTVGGWTGYARRFEDAGADAIELNIYHVAADPDIDGVEVENRYVDILDAVKSVVARPVAVKLGPFFSSFAHMARRLDLAGADALVLFNRFYQPDIDLDALEVTPDLQLSRPYDLRLPLRWIAILRGRIGASLAATGGVHSAADVFKLVMAGADATQMCSALLKRGPQEAGVILRQMQAWMEEKEYASLEDMKGCLSQSACPDPAAFERANYMKTLHSYV